MDGRFQERETGAEYFVRELTDGTVVWVGEHVPPDGGLKAFAHVFFGRRVAPTRIEGHLLQVPKGLASGDFPGLVVTSTRDGFQFELPGAGRRTLGTPDTDLPVTDSLEWGAGFYDEGASLTGVWQCNDGGTYYVRQSGDRVAWVGEHPQGQWCNVFFGRLEGRTLSGRWVDVPKGRAGGSGELTLQLGGISPFATLFDGTRLTRSRVTGGFGGTEWRKTDSVRVSVRPRRLTIVSNADVGGLNVGGDEPYLLPMYITLGGNQYTDPSQLLRENSGAAPLVSSPLFQHEWGTRGSWPKNNLTWQEDLAPGTSLPIPDFIGYAETELRTLSGLQPNSAFARDTANFVPGLIALEEASTRNEDIRAGYRALLANTPRTLHNAIVAHLRSVLLGGTLSPADILPAVAEELQRQFEHTATLSALSDLFGVLGGLDRDKNMGSNFPLFSLGVLRDAALRGASLPLTMEFRGGAGGVWRVSGTICATLGPLKPSRELSQLEVTLETGGDDKRGPSNVSLAVGLQDGTLRGPFRAHGRGQRFADNSLHTAQVSLTPGVLLGSQRDLRISWEREPGDGLFRGADSWQLRRIRVVAFDRLGRRRILLQGQPVDTKFEGNRTLTLPLPRG